MHLQAAIFDLFGTLAPAFSSGPFEQALAEISEAIPNRAGSEGLGLLRRPKGPPRNDRANDPLTPVPVGSG